MHNITHKSSQGLIDAAYRFAEQYHEGQVRKYTGEPYIIHPVQVAQTVASVTVDCEMISAALLHDVIEDTEATYDDLLEWGFGLGIVKLVEEITDVSKPEDGNRAVRKALDREHLAGASDRAKTIKLADIINNSESIIQHDKKFAVVYMEEKEALLKVLVGGDEGLMKKAQQIVDDWNKGDN